MSPPPVCLTLALSVENGQEAARTASPFPLPRRDAPELWAVTTRRRFLTSLAGGGMIFALGGCRSAPQEIALRPGRHTVRSEQLLVMSDFKLPAEHPSIQDLITLRKQVAETLHLPEQRKQVVIYLFTSEQTYRNYLDKAYPGLPGRRAYFVGTSQELAVYTYWGERIQEDLRHEYTHGLLHSSLKFVPLWIDEGLAEYFEVEGTRPGTINIEHFQRLSASLLNGWRPDLKRLEKLTDFSQMQRPEYEESWAWVHFLLHHSAETRDVLIGYLHDLRTDASPKLLSVRLETEFPNIYDRLVAYLASLSTGGISGTVNEPGRIRPPRRVKPMAPATPPTPASPAGPAFPVVDPFRPL